MIYEEIEGDLIKEALKGRFDVIAHGCNCFCTQGAGIAKQMAKTFGTHLFYLEMEQETDYPYEETWDTFHRGDINKLGQIQHQTKYLWFDHPMLKKGESSIAMNSMSVGQENVKRLDVINAYTQYKPGPNGDYDAVTLCMRKINHLFAGKHIGLPLIGCGIAGLIWDENDSKYKKFALYIDQPMVKYIIQKELKDLAKVTIVKYGNIKE